MPGVNTDTCQEEIDHIQTWAADNLKLNRNKTKEIVFSSRREGALALPPPRLNIEHVTSLRVLGVIVNDKLTVADHVTMLLSSCSSLLYAMRMLRSHGTPTTSLHDIFRATLSRASSTRRHLGLWDEFRYTTARGLTRSCVAGNGSAVASMTCRPSPNCLIQPTMTSSTASKPTLHTSSSLTFLSLTRLIFRTVSALVPTT